MKPLVAKHYGVNVPPERCLWSCVDDIAYRQACQRTTEIWWVLPINIVGKRRDLDQAYELSVASTRDVP